MTVVYTSKEDLYLFYVGRGFCFIGMPFRSKVKRVLFGLFLILDAFINGGKIYFRKN